MMTDSYESVTFVKIGIHKDCHIAEGKITNGITVLDGGCVLLPCAWKRGGLIAGKRGGTLCENTCCDASIQKYYHATEGAS